MSETPEQPRPDPWEISAAWTERTRLKEGLVREARKDTRYLEFELPEGALEVHLRYLGGSLVVRKGDLIEASEEDDNNPKSEAIREAIAEGQFPYPLRTYQKKETPEGRESV